MSTECEKCGEHLLDCRCNGLNFSPENEYSTAWKWMQEAYDECEKERTIHQVKTAQWERVKRSLERYIQILKDKGK